MLRKTRLSFLTSVRTGLAVLLLLAAGCADDGSDGRVVEFPLDYPTQVPADLDGSTHEITYDRVGGGDKLWITSPNHDAVVELTLDGTPAYHPLPDDSGPHGIDFDSSGRLWVSLEHAGQVARLDSNGQIVQVHDLPSDCTGCSGPVQQDPHGLGVGADGQTLWYTGKTANTVGRIDPDGGIASFAVPTPEALPIYIRSGPDGNMWFTELTGNKIGRVTDSGEIHEYSIPTPNSRPIAIVAEPDGDAMWFSEEAGNNVARIDRNGQITEFAVPKRQENVLLAGLAFDSEKNLWVQQYVSTAIPDPEGPDYVIKIDRRVLAASPADLSEDDFTFYETPSRRTVMHRIIEGPDGNMWFTELKTNRIGRVRR